MLTETSRAERVTMPFAALQASRAPHASRGLPTNRFLSQDECTALARRVAGFAVGGGRTHVMLYSSWTGNVRWANNQVSTCGDVRNNDVTLERTIRGASSRVTLNEIADLDLEAAIRRAERLLIQQAEDLASPLRTPYTEPHATPALWFDRTYQLDTEARAAAMRALAAPAMRAGMLSAGYIEVSAYGAAAMDGVGKALYYPYTHAQYSVTVRDPEGTGSGWAGVDWSDWGRIDPERLSAVALDKCLRSRHPSVLEPGRYTAILEPQATCDFVAPIFDPRYGIMDRYSAEDARPPRTFSGVKRGLTKIGMQVMDPRITISADPADPDLGYLPFELSSIVGADLVVYHPVTWVEHGVLKELSYGRDPYGIEMLGVNTGLPNNGAFKMTGGSTTVDEMITSTERGILVTRFSDVRLIDPLSVSLSGYTRDGVWLIEHGKISKAVKNFRFAESAMLALNKVEQLGVSQRVFRPGTPTVTPAIKIRDFNFISLADAV